MIRNQKINIVVMTALAVVGSACGSSDEAITNLTGGEGCVGNGDCAAGFVCNLPGSAFFDPGVDVNTCLDASCSADSDCDPGQVCQNAICSQAGCQVDGDCAGGNICRAGACEPAPSASEVARCSVLTSPQTLRSGSTVDLSATAEDANGGILRGVQYVWTSDNPSAVAIEKRTEAGRTVSYAVGGQVSDRAILTASVENSDVDCSGSVAVENLAGLGAGDARVTLIVDTVGTPLDGATVTLSTANGNVEATTDSQGVASFAGAGNVTAVSVFKTGYNLVTVLQPGTNDIFIPVPAFASPNETGGFRGVMDVSAAITESFKIGYAAPALPLNPLDFSLDTIVGDLLSTDLDLSEFNLDPLTNILLPGGLVGAIGFRNTPMVNDERCIEADGRPGETEVGCFLARAPSGRTAGWGVGGQVGIDDVTPLIDLIDSLSGEGDIPFDEVLVFALPLVSRLYHAIIPALDVSTSPMVNGVSDFRRYQQQDLKAVQPISDFSKVTVPTLPGGAGTCDDAAVVVSGAILEGRGLVPLGVGGALDEGERDCRVDGIVDAFGTDTVSTTDGQIALTSARLHSGAEGGQPFLLLVSGDLDTLLSGDNLRATAIVQRAPNGIDPSVSISGPYLDIPEGTIRRAAGQVVLDRAVEGAVMNRITLYNPSNTWIVYAPASETSLDLPRDGAFGSFMSRLNGAFMLSMSMDGSFAENFELGSGKTLDRLIYTVKSFGIQQCTDAAASGCTVQ